ncbi:DUF535 domain-containing protein [Salmonella enterica]|nr:DUF535 domain-containing protein [Salmonella enterica]ELF1294865.1 DUF535 domain-containing protein [Salmonella enterica]ELP9925417.1 DUF535 domain-containing protein [Salmonella enterica]ELP9926160.1 DUF535 domain-containing protein [Salmonella enterica]
MIFMNNVSFLRFLTNVIFVRDPLHGKWKNRKFRLMYLLRCLINPFSSVRYYYELCSLQSINKILEIQPTLPAKIHRPYLHKGGMAGTRRKDIIGHYRFIQNLPLKYQTFLFPNRDVLLTQFTGKKGEDFYIYCSSGGFDREGELMLSLCFNEIPVARLSFSIIPTSKGHCAFIGGLQGAPKEIGPDLIRDVTKSCYGLFPKRIVFEALCSLMSCCNITDILAVSEKSHVFKQLRYRYKKRKFFVAKYSDFWESVAGRPYGNLYQLPTFVERKSFNDLASKKRSEYRKRYALLDQIHEEIRSVLKRQTKK